MGGIGSVATSAVPMLREHILHFGELPAARFSSAACISTDWVRLVPGMRMACDGDIALVEARDELAAHARAPHMRSTTTSTAAGDDHQSRGSDRAAEQRHVDPRGAAHEEVLLLGDPAGDEQRDGGRHERHRSRWPRRSAISTVSAIGVNILPSTPVSVRTGR